MNGLHGWADSLVVKCIAFLLLVLFWVFGTLWEHKTYRNKQVTGGWLLLLLGVTVFVIFSGEVLGVFRWILAAAVLAAGLIGIRFFMKRANERNL
jgi:hypothetical protein